MKHKHVFNVMGIGCNGYYHLHNYICMDIGQRIGRYTMPIGIQNALSAIFQASFRPSECEPDYGQNFGRTEYFAVYAAKIYSITLALLGLLQPSFFKLFSKFLNKSVIGW